jgi:hypothetical protein
MEWIKARGTRLLLAGLAFAAAALTVTACSSGGSPAVTPGSAPGQWTTGEVSKFVASGGSTGDASQDSCVEGSFEHDMSYGYAMAVIAVDPQGTISSATQLESTVVSKYGATTGAAINAQLANVVEDVGTNC